MESRRQKRIRKQIKRENTEKKKKKEEKKIMDRGRKEREGKEEEVAVTGPALWLLARQHCWL